VNFILHLIVAIGAPLAAIAQSPALLVSDDNWISLGTSPGVNSSVLASVVDASGNLYVGGVFTQAGGLPANFIAKWNGSSWSALGSGLNDYVDALAVSGSNVYAGGGFTTAGGTAAKYVAKWDGSSWPALGSGVNQRVNGLAVLGSDLYAGGSFTTAGGKVSEYIARAYLLPFPTLSVRPSSIPQGSITISWPSTDTAGFSLEQASTPSTPASWASNTNSITDDGTTKSVTLPATESAQFFRLRRP
jgi:hypothetical protein